MARAFEVGIETFPCEEAETIGLVLPGTASSQPSSCRERTAPSSVYHEPACEGLRVTMLAVEGRKMTECFVCEGSSLGSCSCAGGVGAMVIVPPK